MVVQYSDGYFQSGRWFYGTYIPIIENSEQASGTWAMQIQDAAPEAWPTDSMYYDFYDVDLPPIKLPVINTQGSNDASLYITYRDLWWMIPVLFILIAISIYSCAILETLL